MNTWKKYEEIRIHADLGNAIPCLSWAHGSIQQFKLRIICSNAIQYTLQFEHLHSWKPSSLIVVFLSLQGRCRQCADNLQIATETREAPQQSFAMWPIRCRLAMVLMPLLPSCTVASVAPIIGVLSVPSDRGCETATAMASNDASDASGVSCFASLYSKFIEMAGRV